MWTIQISQRIHTNLEPEIMLHKKDEWLQKRGTCTWFYCIPVLYWGLEASHLCSIYMYSLTWQPGSVAKGKLWVNPVVCRIYALLEKSAGLLQILAICVQIYTELLQVLFTVVQVSAGLFHILVIFVQVSAGLLHILVTFVQVSAWAVTDLGHICSGTCIWWAVTDLVIFVHVSGELLQILLYLYMYLVSCYRSCYICTCIWWAVTDLVIFVHVSGELLQILLYWYRYLVGFYRSWSQLYRYLGHMCYRADVESSQ